QRAALATEHASAPGDRALCKAWIALAAPDLAGARALLAEALSADASLRGAWLLRAQLDHISGSPADDAAVPGPDVLTEGDQAVIAGWTLRDGGDWAGLRALEEKLAPMGPCESAYEEGLRLRVAWRLAADSPALAREALPMVDRLLATG